MHPSWAHYVRSTLASRQRNAPDRWVSDLATRVEVNVGHTLALEPVPRWLYGAEADGSPIPATEVPARFADHWYGEHMIGVGPYRYAGRLSDGGVRMERSSTYWGEPPAIDAIEFHVIPDRNVAGSQLVSEELDFMFLTPDEYQYAVLECGVQGYQFD